MEPRLLELEEGRFVSLRDPSGLNSSMLLLSPLAYQLTTLMDGKRERSEIISAARANWGLRLDPEQLQQLLNSMDEKLALDNARSRQSLYATGARPAAHAGQAYPKEIQDLKIFLDQLLASKSVPKSSAAQAYFIPHIDLSRGAESFAAAYNHLRPHIQRFNRFIILGISHAYSQQPFVMTRQNFETPFGVVPTDQAGVENLAGSLPFDPFEDEFNHWGEHSIEFQLVFLQHLHPGPFSVVPILCGSFHDYLVNPRPPESDPRIAAFLQALTPFQEEGTCWLASVDLAHMGERFDGPRMSPESLAALQRADLESMEKAVSGRAGDFLATLQADQGARNYCGTSAIYTLLSTLQPSPGELLHYQQCNEPGLTSTVTVAAAAFA